MIKNYFLSIFLFWVFSGFAQKTDSIGIIYRSYFDLPRETMFIHTNKTTYLVGENIWFKNYAFDKLNKKPSVETKNIYMGLYDSIGNQIDKKLYLGTKGSTYGAFEIDSTFTSGTYYIKATTKWMKNFKEDDSFIQKIQIINPKKNGKVTPVINDKEFDIQFLPEGGHLVADIRNSVGVKVLDDKGLGTQAKGVVYNAKKEQVANFSTNFLGIGKFTFMPIAKEKYTAEVVLENSKKIKVPITQIKSKGIGITVNNFRKNETIILLKTNNETLPEMSQNNYTLLIHQNGASSRIPIVFDELKKVLVIPKKKLLHGVNTITLFKNKTPILERMFFHEKDLSSPKIQISEIKKKGDSIMYSISSKLNDKEELDLSVSVLPRGTKSYSPIYNIKSAILLKPYLRGTIESPQYYFNKPKDKKRIFDLDNLLITQGWSRYNWDHIFGHVPIIRHKFEKGITIKGRMNNNLEKVKSLFLYPTKHHKGGFIDVYENGDFFLNNYFPERDEVFKFSYNNDRNKIRKPNIVLRFVNQMGPDAITPMKNDKALSYYNNKTINSSGLLMKDLIELDEIVLEANVDRKMRKEYGLPFRGKLIAMKKDLLNKFPTLSDFLNANGFTTRIGNFGSYEIISNRRMARRVVFYLDNVIVNDYNILARRALFDFEHVYIDTSPMINNFGISQGDLVFPAWLNYTQDAHQLRVLSILITFKVSPQHFTVLKQKSSFTPQIIFLIYLNLLETSE